MTRFGVVAIVLAGASSALADPVDTLSEAAMRSHAGDHAGAIALYEQVYRVDHDPSLLPIIAAEYRLAGMIRPPSSVAPAVAPAPGRFSHRELTGIATAALGLTAIAIGAYEGHRASEISDQIAHHDPTTPWPDDIAAIERKGQRYELREEVLLGIGGAALVTAGVLYWTGRSDRLASERISVAPSVGRSGAGVAISGGF